MKPRILEFQTYIHQDFLTMQHQKRWYTVHILKSLLIAFTIDARKHCICHKIKLHLTSLENQASPLGVRVERKKKGSMCKMHYVGNNREIQKHLLALTTLCDSSLLAYTRSKLLSSLILANRNGNGAQELSSSCLSCARERAQIDGSTYFFTLFISTGSRYSQVPFLYT